MTRATLSLPDADAVDQYFEDHRLTDGLPIVAPTPPRVDAMLEFDSRQPKHVLGRIAGRPHGLTLEQAAVCAVMAGARPEYFPVIVATWDAIFDPTFNAPSVLGSSGGTALTAVVSGPYAAEIGMNATHNLFGPGNRPNATIGRAIRLGVMLLGYRPSGLDGAAFGNQARYTAHFAEAPPAPPWTPLRVRMGYASSSTTVTVGVTDAPRQVTHTTTGNPDNLLAMFAACMADLSHCGAGRGNPFFVVVGPEHAGILQSAGWTEADIADHLARVTRVRPEQLAAAGQALATNGIPIGRKRVMAPGDDGCFPVATADLVHVVNAGGTGAGWSQVLFGYAPASVSVPVTREVKLP